MPSENQGTPAGSDAADVNSSTQTTMTDLPQLETPTITTWPGFPSKKDDVPVSIQLDTTNTGATRPVHDWRHRAIHRVMQAVHVMPPFDGENGWSSYSILGLIVLSFGAFVGFHHYYGQRTTAAAPAPAAIQYFTAQKPASASVRPIRRKPAPKLVALKHIPRHSLNRRASTRRTAFTPGKKIRSNKKRNLAAAFQWH